MGYAFHRLVVDNSGNPVDFEFIDINPAFEKLTGLKSSQILNNIAKKGYLLLENLLDWARLQTNKIDFNPDTVNLSEAVDSAIEVSNLGIIDKKIQVNNSISREMKVLADPLMLDTILRNQRIFYVA